LTALFLRMGGVEVAENRYFFRSRESKIAYPNAVWVTGLIAAS